MLARCFWMLLWLLGTPQLLAAQNIDSLQWQLRVTHRGEEWGQKQALAYHILEFDPLNEAAIRYLVEVYGRSNKKDSIDWLFKRLVTQHPGDPRPYHLRMSLPNAGFEGLPLDRQIDLLETALQLDTNHHTTWYLLGTKHYDAFRLGHRQGKKKGPTQHARAASRYLERLCQAKDEYAETLRYPLIQLGNFLSDTAQVRRYKAQQLQTGYFPLHLFAAFKPGWESDYGYDLFWPIDMGIFYLNWYSEALIDFEEPVLRAEQVSENYRLLWLRSFHRPVVLRMRRDSTGVQLWWKVNEVDWGDAPKSRVLEGSRVLPEAVWEQFEALLAEHNYWQLPTTVDGITGTDGAQWILEAAGGGRYHIVDRWSGADIDKACLFLLDLADLGEERDNTY